MKNSIIFLMFSFLIISCAPYKIITGSKTGKIIEAPGTKDEIYIRANLWMVRSFKNAKSVIQFQDKSEGKIMGKFFLRQLGSGIIEEDIYCLITLSIKDKMTKIEIEPTGNWKYDKSGFTVFNYGSEDYQVDMNVIIDSYQKAITKIDDVWK